MSVGETRQEVLGRKAYAAQRAFEARGMSPAKALRRALSRTADVLWDLALVVHEVEAERLDQDGVIAALGQTDLLVLLDGPDGATGIAALDRQVLTGLVEVQTIQQVTQMPIDDRALTATDAAMVAPMLDDALARFADNLADHPLRDAVAGFRFGAMIEDRRMAALLLEASGYRAFRADVDLALGRRRGILALILPEPSAKARAGHGDDRAPGPHEAVFRTVPARLDTVLARISLPLNKASQLKPGDCLPLNAACIDGLELRAPNGQLVAKGRFGQHLGLRAVRINWPQISPRAQSAAAPDADTGDAPDPAPLDPPAPPALPDPAPSADSPSVDTEEDFPDLPPLDFESEIAAFDGLEAFETDVSG